MSEATEHFDVLIAGAGLSGIGTARHLQINCPKKSFAIFESRGAIGGTWDLFRYPGIRSDSDMFTLGYSFRPWTDNKILADGPAIREYVSSTAEQHSIDKQIRFNHRIIGADWSSDEQLWHVEAERTDTGEAVHVTAGFLMGCTGYYNYEEGYTPTFEGRDDFAGQIVHPQHWPEDLDYAGKRVVVIGSGATAVTLVPAMAEDAGHVTMLQRSPTYIIPLPLTDPIARVMRWILPEKLAYSIVRWKNVFQQWAIYNASQRWPKLVRRAIRKLNAVQLPKDYDVDTHFNPHYDPWDQRLCVVPQGDLFRSIRKGKASIATGEIDRFVSEGVRLTSGETVEADIVVTATGLNLLLIGGIQASIDGKPVHFPEILGYKGMMFGGMPNVAVTIGYTNASWTLKCDLVAEYVCRLLNYMDEHDYAVAMPDSTGVAGTASFIDLQAGYVLRSLDQLPKQGPESPWRLHQNYLRDVRLLKHGSLVEGMKFEVAKSAQQRDSVAV